MIRIRVLMFITASNYLFMSHICETNVDKLRYIKQSMTYPAAHFSTNISHSIINEELIQGIVTERNKQ